MFVLKRIDYRDKYIYCGNNNRNWVTKDDPNIDKWNTYEEAVSDGKSEFPIGFVFGKSWTAIDENES